MTTTDFISPETRTFEFAAGLALDCGATLAPLRIAYQTWGSLAADGGNVVLICHALTGTADAASWWPGIFGSGRIADPDRDFIVCSNVLASCYGSSGPVSIDARTGRRFGPDFPPVTIRDMVRAQALLLDHLGIERIQLAIGGSLGGMQALEWAATYPERVGAIVPIAVSGRHSPWCIAISQAQRLAIRADARFAAGHYPPDAGPEAGLAAARTIAMCSYRTAAEFAARFGRSRRPDGVFEVESWLAHHADRLNARFDANTYIALTEAMDRHDLARDRGDYEAVLGAITAPALVVSITSDLLYPPVEQRELADLLPRGEFALLDSSHGHDAFLIDTDELNRLVADFCRRLDDERRRR